MKTKISINDTLIQEAMQLSGLSSADETVEQALRLMIKLTRQSELTALRGKLPWEGDLDEMRRD